MEFKENEIIDKPKWADLVGEIQGLQEHDQWVFRAMGTWRPESNAHVTVPIRSSFDDACNRRVGDDLKANSLQRRLYEAWILYEFKREAHNYLAHLPEPNNFLEWMALGRHHGMPSRLVDFTYSFFVAAYFALSLRGRNEKGEMEDGCVVALNLKRMKEDWEARRKKDYSDLDSRHESFHSLELFHKFAFTKEGDVGDQYAVVVNPLRRNPRLANQKGCFLCPGNIAQETDKNLEQTVGEKPDVKKLVRLPANVKTEAMQALADMNVSQATLYPDLTGWAESRRDLVHRPVSDDRFKEELEIAIGTMPRI